MKDEQRKEKERKKRGQENKKEENGERGARPEVRGKWDLSREDHQYSIPKEDHNNDLSVQ